MKRRQPCSTSKAFGPLHQTSWNMCPSLYLTAACTWLFRTSIHQHVLMAYLQPHCWHTRLGRLPLEFQEERQDLSVWHLNSSQEQAVCRALARHFQLLHGPPGTGKTGTAAVLMTLFAQRNLGARCAILFGAPDAECAICLDANPDVVTACGHVFHRTCLARCLQQSSQCPLCRQILKQPRGGLRMLRIYGADAERQDFPEPTRVDHPNVQTFNPSDFREHAPLFLALALSRGSW